MVLPFVTILAKVFFCSLADRHRAYRTFFICFLVSSLIGFGSFAVLPFFIKPRPKELGLNLTAWILICIMTSASTISMSVISCLSDAFAMNSSRKNNSSYGWIRLWGTLGWGVSSILLMFINNIKSLPMLVPGLILTIILLVLNLLAQSTWPYKEDFKLDKSASDYEDADAQTGSDYQQTTAGSGYGSTALDARSFYEGGDNVVVNRSKQTLEVSSIKVQWLLFKEVARRRKSLFRYMALFTISGILISLQWSYFFPYLKKLYQDDFTFISALSMVGQSFIGELPFFIISKYFIKLLGRSNTLSLSFIAIGMRYLLYEYLLPKSSMYFVLLTESLQGPCFGLFYVVMTEVGLDYSDCEGAIVKIVREGVVGEKPEEVQKLRQALRATMQSLMSACYEGLGVGTGSIIGGLVIDYYGFSSLWFWSAHVAILLGVLNFMFDNLKFNKLKAIYQTYFDNVNIH